MAEIGGSVYTRATDKALGERLEAKRKQIAAIPPMPFFDWAMRVPEPKAGPLDFDRFPFQRELYEETGMTDEVIVKKATQIGVSAYLVRWTMYAADVKGWTVIYVFPKQNLMWDFADARVKPLIEGSKYLRGRVPRQHVQNKGLRQIGAGFVFYRGSESTDGLESIDADALALDEYDNLVAANVPVVERRLTGSLHGLIRRVGVPSVPGFGLDALYTESDQRRWHVKCRKCRRWMPIFMYEVGHDDDYDRVGFVDQEQMKVVCQKCRVELDVAEGEWVPLYPDRSTRGYHASRLIVPAVARNDRGQLEGIVKASLSPEPYEIQVHNNRDLGEAYAAKEGRLSLEVIKAAQRDFVQVTGYDGDRIVTAGIDVASARAINVRISERVGDRRKKALFIGLAQNFDEVAAMLESYRVNIFVIDHLPEGRLARSLAERYSGRGYLCALAGKQLKKAMSVDEGEHTVTVRRTEAIDAMMGMLRDQRNFLPQDLPEGYAKHLQAPVRFMEKDDLGKLTVGYRSSGPDDYAMAETFDMIAWDVWLFRQEMDALEQGEIQRLEDRLEFQRAHLGDPDAAGGYSPGVGDLGDAGEYSAGFGEGQEGGFDSPWQAWDDE